MPANFKIPQSLASIRFTPSSLLLVAANLLPVYGVLAWNWSLFAVLALFWFETLLVGVMCILKIPRTACCHRRRRCKSSDASWIPA